jgi:polyisoprenoid-binding protein YceI
VASAAGSGPVRFELAASGNEARYRAKEVLAGIGLTEAVGRTTKVTGAVVLDQSGSVIAGDSRITVDLRELRSDDSRRDGYIKDNTLQTARFPAAELVARELRGLASPLPTSGDVSFELLGDLTVHGVTRPSTWQARATVSGGEVRGTASTQATITGFGMEIPQVARVLSLEDTLTLEIDFRGTLSQ